ncbi:MAG: PaaI family thioesterase [Candidatus Phosphoribacter sp.]
MTEADLQAFLDREFPEIGPLGIVVERVDARTITVRLPENPTTLRPGGTISGPTMFALADVAVYLLILAQIGPVALAVTTSVGMNFMRKPPAGDLLAEAELLKLGRRLAVGHVRLHAVGSDELVADASLTYSIPPRA